MLALRVGFPYINKSPKVAGGGALWRLGNVQYIPHAQLCDSKEQLNNMSPHTQMMQQSRYVENMFLGLYMVANWSGNSH